MDGHSQGQDAPIKPNSIKNYYPVIRKKDADNINESIAKMMAVCGVPFSIVKNTAFIAMIEKLCPAFVHGNHLKSPDTFKRKFLPKVYKNVKKEVKKNVDAFGKKDTRRTMGCDGYTTGGGLHVTNFGETTGTKTW